MIAPTLVLPRLAVFGDSHYACLRQAHGLGLVDVSGAEIEYWGHVGTRFHFLALRDGAIVPTDDFTAQRFAKFNEKGRRFLSAADFDMILFVGTRVYVGPLFQRLLHAQAHGPFLSSGLRRRLLQDGLYGQNGYQFAKGLAATGTARIVLSPVAFPTEGQGELSVQITPEVRSASTEDRAALWRVAAEIAAQDGITLIPQPEETVTDGVHTKAEFAVADHIAKRDYEHHNPAYGALIFERAMALVRNTPPKPR
jgi:hypothetical protein